MEETPSAEAKPEAKPEPLKINLQKLAVENGALRYTKTHDATHKDVSEIAPLNVSVVNIRNGQTGKLTLSSMVKVLMNPPAPDTNGTMEAKLDGAFDLTLSADAKPASVQGSAKLQVGAVAGMFAELAGVNSDFTCNFSSAEVKEIALRLQRSGIELAKLQAHGPLSFEKQEGKLYVELVGLDRRALNLLFPGHQISARRTPQFAEGSKVVLEQRGLPGNGWASAWKAACWARLGNGAKAMDNFVFAMHNYTTNSLFSLCSRAMQVDGSFGMAAAVAEMVLQSHENELAFLPALPDSWKDGEVKGLVARGGFEVGLRWTTGLLEHATIFSKIGNTCRIRSTNALKVVSGNKTVRVMKPEKDVWEFKTAPGASYKRTYIK